MSKRQLEGAPFHAKRRFSSTAAQWSALWTVEMLHQDPFDGVGIVRRDRGDDPPTDVDFERHRLVRTRRGRR
jgi:hypothetical protein